MQALPPLLPVAPAAYDATNERTFREALTRFFQQQRTDSAVADPSQSASPIAGRLVKAIGGGVLGLTNLTESGTVLTIDDSIIGTRAVSLASTLAVAGATTLGSLSVAGATVLQSTLAVTGNVTADANATVAGVLGVGPAPRASAGDLRFPNNASVRFRNGANSGDVYGVGVTSGDILLLADSGATLTRIGSDVGLGATAATTGAMRLKNLDALVWRNAANTANLTGFRVDASNFLYVGDTTNAGTELLAGANGIGFEITSGGGTKWRMQGTTPFDFVPWDNFPSNDNRQSVGTSTTRLKSGFFGTSVVTPVVDTASVDLVLKRNAVTQLTLAASAATFVGTVQGTRLISTVATGTAPLTVASTTVVANLHATNSDQLGGVAAASYALLASPAFTGTPTAPTAAPGTNTTQIATTAFVTAAGASFAPVGAQYVTLATDATLTNERVLTPESSVLTLTDGGAGSTVTLGVAANGITNAKFRQGAALSVVGVTGNATANVADIAAASDGQVLRRSGTTLAFGAVDLANANAITGIIPSANVSGAYSGITGVGTLASGAVPASLVTAGTFGAGAYTFPSTLTQNGTTALLAQGAFGTVTVGSNTGTSSTLSINAATGTNRFIVFRTAGTFRWSIQANTNAESGSNAGTNFAVNAYDDAGVFIDTPLAITRAAGGTIAFASGRPITMGSSLAITGALSGVTTLAISSDVTYSDNDWNLSPGTADGADTRRMLLLGGGTTSVTRGAYIVISGNEHATTPGQLILGVGSAGEVTVTGHVVPSADGTKNLGSASFQFNSLYLDNQLISSLATGTAPFSITSTTVCTNLNADLLDGQHGSYYNDAANLTGTVTETHGGTNQSTYTLGDLLYASAANTLSKLAGNTTSTKKFLTQTGTGAVSAAPAWGTIGAADVGAGTFVGTFGFSDLNVSSGLNLGADSYGSGGVQVGGATYSILPAPGVSTTISVAATGSAGADNKAIRLSTPLTPGTGAYLDLWGVSHANAGRVDIGSGGTAEIRLLPAGSIALGAAGSFGGGVRVVFLANATTLPTTNPSGGGILYVDSGALKYRGSSGTVTTVAAA